MRFAGSQRRQQKPTTVTADLLQSRATPPQYPSVGATRRTSAACLSSGNLAEVHGPAFQLLNHRRHHRLGMPCRRLRPASIQQPDHCLVLSDQEKVKPKACQAGRPPPLEGKEAESCASPQFHWQAAKLEKGSRN